MLRSKQMKPGFNLIGQKLIYISWICAKIPATLRSPTQAIYEKEQQNATVKNYENNEKEQSEQSERTIRTIRKKSENNQKELSEQPEKTAITMRKNNYSNQKEQWEQLKTRTKR